MKNLAIDPSVKIEATNRDTGLGLSNGQQYSVVITAKAKRKLQEEFRQQGKPKLFVLRTFMAGMVLLLRYAKIKDSAYIVIDTEYPGQTRLLRSMFFEMWTRFAQDVPVIEFKRVGKSSGAHKVSHEAALNKKKADRVLQYGELKQLVLRK